MANILCTTKTAISRQIESARTSRLLHSHLLVATRRPRNSPGPFYLCEARQNQETTPRSQHLGNVPAADATSLSVAYIFDMYFLAHELEVRPPSYTNSPSARPPKNVCLMMVAAQDLK